MGREEGQSANELKAVSVARTSRRLQTLYVSLLPQVDQIASALIGQKAPAELVHDICVEITLSESRFRRDCAFSTWLYSIVSHHVHNWIRKERCHRKLMRAAADACVQKRALQPDDLLNHLMVADQLSNGLALLTEPQRSCLLLVAYECLSPGEAAALLDITPSAVRMNVHRARARLRRCLEDGP